MRIVFGAAVIALATAACGDQGATFEHGSEARDSAGVSIVERSHIGRGIH